MTGAGRAARSGRRRRRRRTVWMFVFIVILAAAGMATAGFDQHLRASPASHHRNAHRAQPTEASPSAVAEGSPGADGAEHMQPVFAHVDGLEVHVPTEHLVALAYHEASYDDAMEMHPTGMLSSNSNKPGFDPPPDTDGPSYLVQASRGRGTGPTTAVDVLMPRSARVVSPVDGVVRKAKAYKLYGQYPDWIVEIEPTGHPDQRVVMIHLDDVTVRRGDRVSATLSPIGSPRVLPFHSAVNDYVPGGDPHVHLEVKDLTAARG